MKKKKVKMRKKKHPEETLRKFVNGPTEGNLGRINSLLPHHFFGAVQQ